MKRLKGHTANLTALVTLVALSLLIVGCSPSERDSTTESQPGASKTAGVAVSEREAQLTYSRAFEAILWASPALAVMAQVEAGQRDLGAGNHDIIYTSKSMDHRWGGITYNNQSPYWVAGFSVKDEPVVVDIPPARADARFFGSIHDVWWLPLEDFGPAGADKTISKSK